MDDGMQLDDLDSSPGCSAAVTDSVAKEDPDACLLCQEGAKRVKSKFCSEKQKRCRAMVKSCVASAKANGCIALLKELEAMPCKRRWRTMVHCCNNR